MGTMLVGIGTMIIIFFVCAILGVHLGDSWEVIKIWLGLPHDEDRFTISGTIRSIR